MNKVNGITGMDLKMTNYNDGKWHGWNGGECPVHPESVVDILTKHGISGDWCGRSVSWDNVRNPALAFRVTKEHKEPREFWIYQPGTTPPVICHEKPLDKFLNDCVHVREVQE